MNSTFLRILALVLAIGALVMAWSGYRMSTKPVPATTVSAPPPTYPQLVAIRDIPVGVLLREEDVRVEAKPQRDQHGFDSASDAAGKLVVVPIRQGMPVLNSHFARLSTAAQELQPGERGVAIKVNEVIGGSGFVSPGDHVDVLFYLRADRETGNTSSAQVLLRNVRVLAYGENIGEEAPSKLDTALAGGGSEANSEQDKTKKTESKQNKDVKSALLAVAEQDVTRLMLGDSSGVLRLALRGAESITTAASGQDTAHFLRLGQVARADQPVVQPVQGMPAAAPAKRNTAAKKPRPLKENPTVIVHQGDQVEVVQVSR